MKGERSLRTCGMLDHNKNKAKATGIYLPEADQQVQIYFVLYKNFFAIESIIIMKNSFYR